MWIAVRGPGRQPRELLAIIRAHFEEIHRGISGLAAEERVPVPGYPQILLDYRRLLVREASGKSTVEFETATETIEVPLGQLLDNFETPESRRKSVTYHFDVHEGGRVYVPRELHEIHMSGGTVHGNVGAALATRALPGEKPFPASATSSPCALEGDRPHIVMDIPELITQSSRFLIPALPVLWHASKEAAEKISDGVLKKTGEAAGSAAVEAGRKIWSWLQPHAEQRPGLREAIEEVAARPEDPDAHGTLRTQMRKLLEAQPQLVPELEKIVAQVQVSVQQNTATASGTGAVAIGGNASGVTISTNVTHGHS